MREFFVDTPLGKLRVWAKSDVDDASDYPGVYIDLIPKNKPVDFADDYMIACIEYDSSDNKIQSCLYQPTIDEPVEIVVYDGGHL